MDDLFDKLKALGLKIEKAAEIEAPAVSAASLDEAVSGQWLDEVTRGVYRAERSMPFGKRHGSVLIEPPDNIQFESLWQLAGMTGLPSAEKLLFIDTETSSLSTGAGSLVFMIGMSYFTGDAIQTTQLFLEKPEYELELLCFFDDFINKFDTFVSYNGKAFDIPMLRSRFIMNRLSPAFNTNNHLDLLHVARRIWKLRLDSRRLADIEQQIMAFTRSEEEIPGWLVPQIYFDYLESRDADPIRGVFYHNEMDVVSLAALSIFLARMLSKNDSIAEIDARDSYSIGSAYGRMGRWELSRDFLKDCLHKGMPDDLTREAAHACANTFKKQGKWEEALEYWQFAASLSDYPSCIELAMYYEHQQKDIQSALQWVAKAFQIMPSGQGLAHRKKRLQSKSELKHER